MSGTRLNSVLHYVRKVLGNPADQGSDGDLLQRFVEHHDETAFELLLWRHAALVLGVCQGVLRDSHAAEDAFQATFLALARKAASITRTTSLAAWLYQVAYRVAVRARFTNVKQREVERQSQGQTPPGETAGPMEETAQRDLIPLVHEELNRLSSKYRTPIILCYLEGKTHAEAAAQLGWAKGTVSGRLARGREMLKKRLVRRGILFPAALLTASLAAAKIGAMPPGLVASTVQAASAFAAGNLAAAHISMGVIQLTHGVLQVMCLSKMKTVLLVVTALLLTFGGAGALIRIGNGDIPGQASAADPEPTPPPLPGFGGPGAGTGAPDTPRDVSDDRAARASRIVSINNLKQIVLAFHNYHETFGHLPGDITDKEGRPLLSWRVAILPFIEQDHLYKQFKLDEPWDSVHNKKLLAKMPSIYQIKPDGERVPDPFGGGQPGVPGTGRIDKKLENGTYYQGFAGKGTVLEPGASLKFSQIPDGTSNTVLIVEADSPVPWTKPADIPYSAKKPIPALGVFPELIHAAFADGSVHTFRKKFDQKEMRKAIVRDDGEQIDLDKLHLPAKKPADVLPGVPGSSKPPPGNLNLDQLRDENVKLEKVLRQTVEEMRALQAEMEQLKEQFALKRQEEVEAQKLLAQREQLKQQIEQANAELKVIRAKLEELKHSLKKP